MATPSTKTRKCSVAAAAMLTAGLVALNGCIPGYYPGGPLASLDLFTYPSTVDYPQNIRLIDLTTNATLWSYDIPVNQQVVIQFFEEHDKKNTTRPDLMRWEIMDIGSSRARDLSNSMPVPRASERRVDVYLRPSPAIAPAEPAAGYNGN
jgi:hypothetical protein